MTKELTPKQALMESYAACLKTSKNSSLRTYDLVEKNENDFFNEILEEGHDINEVYSALMDSGELTEEEVAKVSVAYSNAKKKLDESVGIEEVTLSESLTTLHKAWKNTAPVGTSGWGSKSRTPLSDFLWKASTDVGHLGPAAGMAVTAAGAAMQSPTVAASGIGLAAGSLAAGAGIKAAQLGVKGITRLNNVRNEYKKLKAKNESEISEALCDILCEVFDDEDVAYILETNHDLTDHQEYFNEVGIDQLDEIFGIGKRKGLRNPSMSQLNRNLEWPELDNPDTMKAPNSAEEINKWARHSRVADIIKKKRDNATKRDQKLKESEEQLDEIDHSLPREERLKILAQKVDRHVSNQWERGHKVSQRGWKENARVLAPINAKYAGWWEEPRGSGKHVGQLKDQNGDRGETVPLTDDEHKILSKFVKTSEKYKKLTRPLYWSSTRWSGAQDQLDPKNHQYEPGDIMNQPKNWPKHDDRVGGMHKYLGANRGAPRGDYHYPDGAKYNPQTDKMDRDGAGVPKGKIYKGSILDRVKHALKKKY